MRENIPHVERLNEEAIHFCFSRCFLQQPNYYEFTNGYSLQPKLVT
jgi:hypothetical protein